MDELYLAGRPVVGVRDGVRRYCGLPWAGGAPETWAYRYFDAVETDPEHVVPVDVLAAGSLHPGLSHADLAYFVDHAALLDEWLSRVPTGLGLEVVSDDLLACLAEPLEWPAAPALALLSKVLHRKRPELVPLVDRHVLDWYRPVTGERTARGAWKLLLGALSSDLLGGNAPMLSALTAELRSELSTAPSPLRLIDIALWMRGRA